MKFKKIYLLTLLAFGLFLLISPVLAQKSAVLTNPLGTTDAPALIGRIIKGIMGIVGSIALLMFLYGGFLWLTSAGNEQKITKGKQVLVWAVIGLAVIFLSYTLVDFVIRGITGGSATEETQTSTIGTCRCQDGYLSVGATQTSCNQYQTANNTTCTFTLGTP